jgi:hypothetical protein
MSDWSIAVEYAENSDLRDWMKIKNDRPNLKRGDLIGLDNFCFFTDSNLEIVIEDWGPALGKEVRADLGQGGRLSDPVSSSHLRNGGQNLNQATKARKWCQLRIFSSRYLEQ